MEVTNTDNLKSYSLGHYSATNKKRTPKRLPDVKNKLQEIENSRRLALPILPKMRQAEPQAFCHVAAGRAIHVTHGLAILRAELVVATARRRVRAVGAQALFLLGLVPAQGALAGFGFGTCFGGCRHVRNAVTIFLKNQQELETVAPMGLRNVHDLPPHGFFIYCPETEWTSTKHVGLDAAARELQRHRASNPRFGWKTDLPSCEQDILIYTEARLRSMRGGERWLTDAPSSDPPSFYSQRPRVRVGAATGNSTVRKAVAGVGIMLDILGPTLKAVPQDLAEKRATVCVSCPKNKPSGIMAEVVGEGLRLLMESRADHKLVTSQDSKLERCEVCDCRLVFKTHVQMDYILSKTTPEQMASFPDFCWIKRRDA